MRLITKMYSHQVKAVEKLKKIKYYLSFIILKE